MPALRRAVAILDMVSNAGSNLNAAEITRNAGLPKSTVHGLLAVMSELNLLVKNDDGRFSVGAHPMRWANSFLGQMDIVSIFRNYFANEPALDHYTVTLTIRDHDEVVYIGCRNSDQPLGHSFRIGMRLPAPYTATGKMLLSELTDQTISDMFAHGLPPALSGRSVKDINLLKQELAETRTRGYSIDDGQIREGMICIGAAIRDHTGYANAGIAISLLESEATAETIEKLGHIMQKAASDLSMQMGYSR
ncbi:IclR family transcriptional regulator [Paenochrobactrum sp. BZR 588]|uniref:IclR family transcriptional regulator n=1 Tax=Paenochrobactrum TaxID=999488 RepID=UPI0035BC72FC